MKQILLALVLIAAPVAIFFAGNTYLVPHSAEAAAKASQSLGDLSALKTIINDVDKIANTGDMVAAEKRITDFESAWDDAQPKLQALNGEAWGVVDGAADKALKALRAKSPDAAKVAETLTALSAALDNPDGAPAAAGGELKVSGIIVSDANGHALPCEVMIKSLKEAIATNKIAQANSDAANDFVAKALERCNADDDTHADEFSAQGLALASK
jgi:hypothetical protein